jgi:catechol 1,2-dioxygenase
MIIGNEQDVTRALLDDLAHAPDARFREIMSVVVRHLHDLAREVRLTEAEFHQACAVVANSGNSASSA